MFDYLTPHDGPVVDGLEVHERVYAKNQPQYIPLRTLPGSNGDSAISRWHPTEEQRKAIAEGADIYLEILHYGGPLAPSKMMVMSDPEPYAVFFREWWKAQTGGNYPVAPWKVEEVSPAPATPEPGNASPSAVNKLLFQPFSKMDDYSKFPAFVVRLIIVLLGLSLLSCIPKLIHYLHH